MEILKHSAGYLRQPSANLVTAPCRLKWIRIKWIKRIKRIKIASPYFETLFIEVKLKNSAKGLVIGVIYRHPSTSLSEFKLQFTQTLSILAKHKKEYIICGDFNVNLFKIQSSPPINEYIDSVFSEGCYCIIDKPTRITPHSSTLLDHVYTNILNKTLTSNILQYEISDQFAHYRLSISKT